MEGMGEQKLYFLLLKFVKPKKAQFWEKCLNSFCPRLLVAASVFHFLTAATKFSRCSSNKKRPFFYLSLQLSVALFLVLDNTDKEKISLSVFVFMGHLHDGVILLLGPEPFSFFFSYLNLVIPARCKWQKP